MTGMWKVLGTKVGFQGWRIKVRTDRILNPDGRETTRDIVEHPGAVTVVALPAPGKVILIRQYRHATGKELLELPAGTREEGEDPIDTAKRELEEETGYRAARIPTACGLLYRPGFHRRVDAPVRGDRINARGTAARRRRVHRGRPRPPR